MKTITGIILFISTLATIGYMLAGSMAASLGLSLSAILGA